MALQFTTALRNARADAITSQTGGSAKIKIYSGTPPANANASLSGNTLLATLTCNATFAPSASGGVLTGNSISNDPSAVAAGTATFFRLETSGGTVTTQGTVGTSLADLILNTTAITVGAIVGVTALVWTEPT